MKIVSISLLLASLSLNTFAQKEFLTTLNPSSGVFTKKPNHISGVGLVQITPRSYTFDEIGGRYIFVGKDNLGDSRLYSINATTGASISNPLFPVLTDKFDYITELQFDNAARILYGIHWISSKGENYLCSINMSTGSFTDIASLPVSGLIGTNHVMFNKNNHHYILTAKDQTSSSVCLFSINAPTASVVTKPLFPVLPDPSDNISELQYDNLSNTIYGMHWDASESRNYLVSINPTTGKLTSLDSIPGLKTITSSPHYTTFDENNHRYIFKGEDRSGKNYLYSVDVITKKVVSKPAFPILAALEDNVLELKFDNASQKLYGLHWQANSTAIHENEIDNHILDLYPNPFSISSKIILDKSYREVTVIIYNVLGQALRQETHFNSSTIDIQRENLAPGDYFVSLIADQKNIGTKKIVIQ